MSTINPRDIHTIDNVLIRAGQLAFVLILLAWLYHTGLAFLVLTMDPTLHMYEIEQDGDISMIFSSDDINHVRQEFPASNVEEAAPQIFTPMALAYGTAPLVLLLVGGLIRRREDQILAVWKLLDGRGEVTMTHIEETTELDRPDILRIMAIINEKGEESFELDHKRDTLFDSRLHDFTLFIESCATCGETVDEKARLSLAVPQKCPYCRMPLLTDAVIAEHGLTVPEPKALSLKSSFSIALFIGIMATFWPAAILYALVQTRLFVRSRETYTKMQYPE